MKEIALDEIQRQRFEAVRDNDSSGIALLSARESGHRVGIICAVYRDGEGARIDPLYAEIHAGMRLSVDGEAPGDANDNTSGAARMLEAVATAVEAHGQATREPGTSGATPLPYTAHPVAVAALLARTAPGVSEDALGAALCHDVLEDTSMTPEALEKRIGAQARAMVEALTEPADWAELTARDKTRRACLRIEHQTEEVRLIRVCDKLVNVTDATADPPARWAPGSEERYRASAAQIVAACGPLPSALEAHARKVLGKTLEHARANQDVV